MKKRYQIDQQRAVQQFRRLATEQNPNVQMILPLADIVGMLQQGVGNLLRETGLALMQTVMEEEVRHLAGERHQQHEGRRAHRWGKEEGYCVVDGQKVPMRRTRLRTPDGEVAVERLAVGECQYTFLLNDAGGVIDDLYAYRLAPDAFSTTRTSNPSFRSSSVCGSRSWASVETRA